MCTHGGSGLGRWIYGTVAEQVLHHSPVPVLLVYPTGEAQTMELESGRMTFLVPLDGSTFAEAALPHAVALARTFDGELLLLRALEPRSAVYTYPTVVHVAGASDEVRGEAEAYLKAMVGRLRGEGISAERMMQEGWPANVITCQAAALESCTIIMATHGRSGVARLLLGSVALEVVRRSATPILLIRPREQPAEADQPDATVWIDP